MFKSDIKPRQTTIIISKCDKAYNWCDYEILIVCLFCTRRTDASAEELHMVIGVIHDEHDG